MKALTTLLSFVLIGLSFADEKLTVDGYKADKQHFTILNRNTVREKYKEKLKEVEKMDIKDHKYEIGEKISIPIIRGQRRMITGNLQKIMETKVRIAGHSYLISDFPSSVQEKLHFTREPKKFENYKKDLLKAVKLQEVSELNDIVSKLLAKKGYTSNVLTNSTVINGQYWTNKELGLDDLKVHFQVSKYRARMTIKSGQSLKSVSLAILNQATTFYNSKKPALLENHTIDIKRTTLGRSPSTFIKQNFVIHQYLPKFNKTWNLIPVLSATKTLKGYKLYTFSFKVDPSSIKEVKGFDTPESITSKFADAATYKLATEKEIKEAKVHFQKAKEKAEKEAAKKKAAAEKAAAEKAAAEKEKKDSKVDEKEGK